MTTGREYKIAVATEHDVLHAVGVKDIANEKRKFIRNAMNEENADYMLKSRSEALEEWEKYFRIETINHEAYKAYNAYDANKFFELTGYYLSY